LTKKISNPVADSRYVISESEGSYVLWDNKRLEPLSKHRPMAAAERMKAIMSASTTLSRRDDSGARHDDLERGGPPTEAALFADFVRIVQGGSPLRIGILRVPCP
jgi:hypothetical protein